MIFRSSLQRDVFPLLSLHKRPRCLPSVTHAHCLANPVTFSQDDDIRMKIQQRWYVKEDTQRVKIFQCHIRPPALFFFGIEKHCFSSIYEKKIENPFSKSRLQTQERNNFIL